MSRSFDLGNKIRRQKNGIATPPNEMARIAPPEWRNEQVYLAPGSFSFTVPQNVYQILAMVWGGGGTGYNNGSSSNRGGGGGGFAMGVIDVVPGQILPLITVGSISGTSSVGSLLSATGGTTATTGVTGVGGTGVVSPVLRQTLISTGGSGTQGYCASGGSAGSATGNGTSGGYLGDAGLPFKPNKATAKSISTTVSDNGNSSNVISASNVRTLTNTILNPIKFFEQGGGDLVFNSSSTLQTFKSGSGGFFGAGGDIVLEAASTIAKVVTGDGGFGAPSGSYLFTAGTVPTLIMTGNAGFGAPAGIGNSSSSVTLGNSGQCAGGSCSSNGARAGGYGAVILSWTEGY